LTDKDIQTAIENAIGLRSALLQLRMRWIMRWIRIELHA